MDELIDIGILTKTLDLIEHAIGIANHEKLPSILPSKFSK
jgi:hypothetical protein